MDESDQDRLRREREQRRRMSLVGSLLQGHPMAAIVISSRPDGVVPEGAIFYPVTNQHVAATPKDVEDGKMNVS
jgi:hypothetical protein